MRKRLEERRGREGGNGRKKESKAVVILLVSTWTLHFTLPMHF